MLTRLPPRFASWDRMSGQWLLTLAYCGGKTKAHQCLGQEVNSKRVCVREQLGKWSTLAERQRTDIVA